MAKNLSQKIENDIQKKAVLLLVDDDSLIRETLSVVLSVNYTVISAESREEAHKLLLKSEYKPHLALVDLGLPPVPHQVTEGFALLNDLLAYDSEIKIIVLEDQNKYADIKHALTLGAADFIPKTETVLLQECIQHQLNLQQVEKKEDSSNIDSAIVGESKVMMALREKINQFSNTVFPILIEGESGTGKELIAKTLHQQSLRNEKPFLVMNCAAVEAKNFESILFGKSRGAFSGSLSNTNGLFNSAEEGVLFFENIDEMPVDIQVKIVRVIDDAEYYQFGDNKTKKLKTKIIAASNKILANEVKAGRFREDLYQRLSMLTINVPALCERENDSLLLLRHFRRLFKDSIKPFTLNAAATALWMQYDFPGNIRELRNIVIRLGTKYTDTNINYDQLADELEINIEAANPEHIRKGFGAGKFNDAWLIKQISSGSFDLNESLSDLESYCIQMAMKLYDNNLSKAAKALKIKRTALYNRLNKNKNEKGNS